MGTSIIEHLDGAFFAVETRQDGEYHVFDIVVEDSLDDLGQTEFESYFHYMIFNYSLLGDPNAVTEDAFGTYGREDEYA